VGQCCPKVGLDELDALRVIDLTGCAGRSRGAAPFSVMTIGGLS
jgi:hypothetical protein